MISILTGAVASGTAVLFVCLGEVISERSGVINLGAEGSMLLGAFTSFIVTVELGSPYVGALFGGLAGLLLALVHVFLVTERAADQLACGLALMVFAQGLTAFYGDPYVGEQIQGLNTVPLPYLSSIPILGQIFFRHDVLTYLAMVIVPVVWFFLNKTRTGLMIRATGERESVVEANGLSPRFYRYMAVTMGGFLAGIGGSQLAVARTFSWSQNMTQGRGIVAVALVIFAAWKPLRTIVAAYLLGGTLALQMYTQSIGANISIFWLSMLPYVITLLVLLALGQQRHAMPEGLKNVFEGSSI